MCQCRIVDSAIEIAQKIGIVLHVRRNLARCRKLTNGRFNHYTRGTVLFDNPFRITKMIASKKLVKVKNREQQKCIGNTLFYFLCKEQTVHFTSDYFK